jgi:hypothetical protein
MSSSVTLPTGSFNTANQIGENPGRMPKSAAVFQLDFTCDQLYISDRNV